MTLLPGPPIPYFLERAFPFERRTFITPGGERMSFVDEGSGQPVVLVHGNPTWGYLYRKIIPGLLERGFRVIAPDLIGFGFSDKPLRPGWHLLDRHVESVRALLDALELEHMIIFGQDWGGPVIAGAAARMERTRTHAAVFGNTAILKPARPFRSKGFHKFSHMPVVSDLVFRGLAFPIPVLWQVQGDKTSIGPTALRAYYYPFRMPWNRAGPLGLARMVPDAEDHPSTPVMDALGEWWSSFDGPIGLVWGRRDPILGRSLKRHREAFPQAAVVETDAGHFLQEEVPGEIEAMIERVSRLSCQNTS